MDAKTANISYYKTRYASKNLTEALGSDGFYFHAFYHDDLNIQFGIFAYRPPLAHLSIQDARIVCEGFALAGFNVDEVNLPMPQGYSDLGRVVALPIKKDPSLRKIELVVKWSDYIECIRRCDLLAQTMKTVFAKAPRSCVFLRYEKYVCSHK